MNEDTREFIESIARSCTTCAEISDRPISFSVRMPDDVVFNQELLIDIMYKDKRPILHIVDRGTRFSAAKYLKKADAKTVWNTFIQLWSTMYIGHTRSILTDQGSVFMCAEWKGVCRVCNIEPKSTGIESHNSLNEGESLHASLRRILNRLENDFPELNPEIALSLAVQALNSTANVDGLCPMLLVFGVQPSFPDVVTVQPSHVQRFMAMKAARDEYAKVIAAQRVARALRTRPPAAADSNIVAGDMVYVYREKPKKWIGPLPCVYRDGKQVILSVNGVAKAFNISQVKRAPLENPNPEPSVFITEIIEPDDPRSSHFDAAKRKEILGLIDRGTFAIVVRPDTDEKLNILPSRFVLAIKNTAEGKEILKARFVIGGHRDRSKDKLVHVSNTVRKDSVRMLLSLASILGFDVWSTDIRQAYLQSNPLLRDVYVKPPDGVIELGPDELLKLLKPLYGLSDAGDYWSTTLNAFHVRMLRMREVTGDFALFFRHICDKIVGLSATFVDDLLETGSPEYRREMEAAIRSTFDISNVQDAPLTYAGADITTHPYTLSQAGYIRRLSLLPSSATFQDFASQRQKIAWITHSRPDISCRVSFAAQVTETTYCSSDIASLNSVVEHLQTTSDVRMKFPKLDKSSLQLIAYADSSFCNLRDGDTQIGYIIVLADDTKKCSILSYRSYNVKRIVRSSGAGETLALADSFDAAIVLRHDLETILHQSIPLLLLTDSQSLFSVLTVPPHDRTKAYARSCVLAGGLQYEGCFKHWIDFISPQRSRRSYKRKGK